MYVLIVNPVAGEGRGMKVYQELKQHSLYQQKNCRSFLTEYQGHGKALATQVAQMYGTQIKAIIVVGGDGTLNEVMNGLKTFPAMNVAIIPAGSGNDFARACKIERKPVTLFKQIINNPSWRSYRLGKITKETSRKQTPLFANSIGIGFDAVVAKQADESKYKKYMNLLRLGMLSYLIALFQVLFTYQTKKIQLVIDGKPLVFQHTFMVTVTNHPFFGGGMKIVPHAKMDSGRLYVLIIDHISKWKVLFLFFTVFFGKHTTFKEVYIYEASEIKVILNEERSYQIDGQTGKIGSFTITKDHLMRKIHRF
ncbi:diacylglycerol/lipid kinase family protein [Salinibacillus xinjiangensis]|uniref:YegS/Rv2252/BmrU family lipid kinase n=1 Tax=Salinibacillus xinjiangensis TaxID=1229268 RepID=A0A6G1XAD6_9BACI|nr:YegS/Rv2252/BmrU family lipid kinase [Salinibacillus xinjiangensis]MRG87748.1 YegS/Rv2252/BmrU family lipid kinase [Salinibacillus xinjiangensis]